jgi:hypothetical protein
LIVPSKRTGFAPRGPSDERLVWALVVVAIDDVVELGLLLEEVAGRGFGRLELEREMHAFLSLIYLLTVVLVER